MRSPCVVFSLLALAILYSGSAEATCTSPLDPACSDASPPAALTPDSGKIVPRTGKGVWRSIGRRGGAGAKAVASDGGPL